MIVIMCEGVMCFLLSPCRREASKSPRTCSHGLTATLKTLVVKGTWNDAAHRGTPPKKVVLFSSGALAIGPNNTKPPHFCTQALLNLIGSSLLDFAWWDVESVPQSQQWLQLISLQFVSAARRLAVPHTLQDWPGTSTSLCGAVTE